MCVCMWGGGGGAAANSIETVLKKLIFKGVLTGKRGWLNGSGQLSVLTLISVSVPPPCYHSST